MFDAMLFKREIGTRCSIEVKMLDTLNDGIVLVIEEKLVAGNNLVFMEDFVSKHNLSLLLEHERYFISTNALTPAGLYVWEN
jgi:hypothetical protein